MNFNLQKKVIFILLLTITIFSNCKKDINKKFDKRSSPVNYEIEEMKHIQDVLLNTFTKEKQSIELIAQKATENLYSTSIHKELFTLNELILSNARKASNKSIVSQIITNVNNYPSNFYNKEINSLSDKYSIYFPYSEEFQINQTSTITLTFHPLTNNKENIGIRFNPINNKTDTVIVNDDYAFKNPTYIVVPNSIDDFEFQKELISQQFKLNLSKTSTRAANPSASVNLIQLGKLRCEKDYDGLFDMGAELIFLFATPEYNASIDSYTLAPNWQRYNLSRRNVRKKEIVTTNITLLTNWKKEMSDAVIWVFEFDKGWKSGNIEVTVKGQKYGVNINIPDKGTFLGKTTYSRDDFFKINAQNGRDLGNGIWDGWPVHRYDGVTFNLPIQSYE